MSDHNQKYEAAKSRWEAVQLQAANAMRELDYAVAVFEKDKTELDQETIDALYAQITAQKKTIEDFVMKSRTVFMDESKKYEFRANRSFLA